MTGGVTALPLSETTGALATTEAPRSSTDEGWGCRRGRRDDDLVALVQAGDDLGELIVTDTDRDGMRCRSATLEHRHNLLLALSPHRTVGHLEDAIVAGKDDVGVAGHARLDQRIARYRHRNGVGCHA